MDGTIKITPTPMKSFPDVRETVEQTENLVRLVPLGIMAVLVGLPVLSQLLRFHLVLAILNGVIMFFVAGFVVKLVDTLVLTPIRSTRYKGIAARLDAAARSGPEPVTQHWSWSMGAPGALAVTQHGSLVIIDRSTDYEELRLHPTQIANVSVEREATQITNIRHGGSFTLGGASGGLFGGYTFGGRSKATTHTVETAFVEIRYQLERNGMTYTTVIPFGADRRSADGLCATLSRLEAID